MCCKRHVLLAVGAVEQWPATLGEHATYKINVKETPQMFA